MDQRAKRLRGFTLVEVMVALLVVGIALPALLSQISTQAEGTADLRDRSFAQWVAQNQLEILRLNYEMNEQLLEGEASGESEMAGRTWYWTATSEPTEMEGMWRQTVDVGTEPDEVIVSLLAFIKEHEENPEENSRE
ncbi:type II secretion system minor pseudopilin GspI [Gilvimarinus sp. F26214L]|uniref:type II secretion system minor pseudopilin GspI n=1 Tax=Gilvimarinus sp. DZF01 TaxID=3461371 RepID=UPI0040460474